CEERCLRRSPPGRAEILPRCILPRSARACLPRARDRLGFARAMKVVSEFERPELRGTRVLVVDDDADNREMLAMILEYSGALVATADSAAEAMCVLERERSQVLISDIGLPDEDGFSLLRRG